MVECRYTGDLIWIYKREVVAFFLCVYDVRLNLIECMSRLEHDMYAPHWVVFYC